jgi:hypothetical protein
LHKSTLNSRGLDVSITSGNDSGELHGQPVAFQGVAPEWRERGDSGMSPLGTGS